MWQHRLWLYKDRTLQAIFGPKCKEIKYRWSRLYSVSTFVICTFY
jgi:hypothetical protein